MKQEYDADGLPVEDIPQYDPSASRDALTAGLDAQTQATTAAASGPDPSFDPGNPAPYITTPPNLQGGGAAPAPSQGITDPGVKAPDQSSGNTAANPYGSDNNPNTDYQTTWSAGPNSQPTNPAPAGWHWDASMARYVADAAPAATTPTGQPPSGGSLSDPNYAAQFVQYWGSQPGVNPSVKNDPSYWIGRFTSGAFGNDQNYAIQRMMQAEGAPEGAGVKASPASVSGPSAPSPSGGTPGAPTIGGNSAYNEQIRQILLQQIAGLSAPTTAESPDVAPAISAFNTQSQRDQATDRDALAERYYAAGDSGNALQSGGFNTSVQQGLEKSAGDRANFTGSTIFQAAQSKKQQLQQMLQTATQAGLQDTAQQIQAQIAQIDAQLREQGLNQQNSQFGDSLGYSYASLLAQMNRDTLTAGLQ